MPRAWLRMPAAYDLASGDSPYDDSASANEFRLSSIEYRLWWVCMPEPLMPWIGLGMNVAYRPCCCAMAFSVNLKVIALSAVWSASAYSKSISCWPAATSWMGRLDADPERLERIDHVVPDRGREVRAEVEVAGLVVRQRLDGAVLAAAEQEELELGARVDDVAELLGPLDLAAQDEARVAGERLAARREHVADDAGRGAVRPRDLGEGPHVRHQVLVALGDPGEAFDGRAVEPRAVPDGALQLVDRDRHRLDDADDVRELELDEPDALGLRRLDLLDA